MFAQNSSVKKDCGSLIQGVRGKLPFEWREQPRPAEDIARVDRTGYNPAFAGGESSFEFAHALFDKIKSVRGFTLVKNDLTFAKVSAVCNARENSFMLIAHSCEKTNPGNVICQIVHVHLFAFELIRDIHFP